MIFQQLQPAHAAHLPAQHLLPHGAGRHEEGRGAKSAPWSFWSWWACRIRPMPTRPSSPAASSSASPSPGPWPPIPRCCCATRPPAPWTPTPPSQILELIRDINRQLGITVVIITHQMSVVKEICNHVAILDGGEVAGGGPGSRRCSAAPKSAGGRAAGVPRGGRRAWCPIPPRSAGCALDFQRQPRPPVSPLVARLAAEESIYCNVISASTQKLSARRPTAVCCWASPAAHVLTGPWTIY